MAAFDNILGNVTGTLKGIVDFGLGLIVVLLVVQVLFPNVVDIVGNLSSFVGMFTGGGVEGLIVALLIISLYSR